MKEAKVLFIAQEITPYLPESEIANICRNLPQGIQDRGHEIRTFMPKYGSINERRNQLHEVIRLSGMNLIIDDTDHPLIIKVASIQSARMQVYFIDNDDYFQRNADGVVDELYTSLLKSASWHEPEQYFIFYDFDSYKKARLRVNHDYCDRIAFGRKCLMNVASAGKFSSDRTIRQYAEDIWHIQPVK